MHKEIIGTENDDYLKIMKEAFETRPKDSRTRMKAIKEYADLYTNYFSY